MSLPGPRASTDTCPKLGVVALSKTGVVPAGAALGEGGELPELLPVAMLLVCRDRRYSGRDVATAAVVLHERVRSAPTGLGTLQVKQTKQHQACGTPRDAGMRVIRVGYQCSYPM